MEYQPRSSTSERDFGPVTLFDNHLKYLNDSYLNFFTERRRVEETYMELLNKLHRKVKSIDGYLDDRHEPSTTRRAWGEIRDSVERDVQARAAFVSSLTVDVINPLITLKVKSAFVQRSSIDAYPRILKREHVNGSGKT